MLIFFFLNKLHILCNMNNVFLLFQNKFASLILAFKTDKLTLKSRLELQNRLRDQSELNMTMEVSRLREAVQVSNTISVNRDMVYMNREL